MNYVPKKDLEGINYSKDNPLINFIYLVSVVFLFAGILIGILSIFGSYIFASISPKYEEKLFSHIDIFDVEKKSFDEGEAVLKKLIGEKANGFKVGIWCTSDVNAVAIPGKKILVTSGLLNRITTENELAIILGHEYGHFVGRDHLRSIGSGLTLVLTFSLLGELTYEMPLINLTSRILQSKFSREQETKADLIGRDLVIKEYGDTKTAANVFKIFSELDNHFYFLEPEFLSSHPESLKRYEELSKSRKSEERVVYKRYEGCY